jgi:GNAT superfamily N-acetyltransferase
MIASAAKNGGVFLFQFAGRDAAVAIVNPRLNVLLALAVTPSHQGHGLGSAVLRYLACNFARVESRAVGFFERNGFVSVGEPKKGKTLYTQIMVRDSLRSLAGRISAIYGASKTGPPAD